MCIVATVPGVLSRLSTTTCRSSIKDRRVGRNRCSRQHTAMASSLTGITHFHTINKLLRTNTHILEASTRSKDSLFSRFPGCYSSPSIDAFFRQVKQNTAVRGTATRRAGDCGLRWWKTPSEDAYLQGRIPEFLAVTKLPT